MDWRLLFTYLFFAIFFFIGFGAGCSVSNRVLNSRLEKIPSLVMINYIRKQLNL